MTEVLSEKDKYLRDSPWPHPHQLVIDSTTGNKGYIVGMDFEDGAVGYMEIFEDGDITGKIISVEPRSCKPVEE